MTASEIKGTNDPQILMQFINDANKRLIYLHKEMDVYDIAIAQTARDIINQQGQNAFKKIVRKAPHIYAYITLFDVLNFDPCRQGYLDFNGIRIGGIYAPTTDRGSIRYSYKGILTTVGQLYIYGNMTKAEAIDALYYYLSHDVLAKCTQAGIIKALREYYK